VWQNVIQFLKVIAPETFSIALKLFISLFGSYDKLSSVLQFDNFFAFVTSSSSMIVRRTRLSTVGDRTFPVVAARIWNELPRRVTSAPSQRLFLCLVNTHRFNHSSPDFLQCLWTDFYHYSALYSSVLLTWRTVHDYSFGLWPVNVSAGLDAAMHAGLSITFRLLGDCMKRVLMTDACTRGKTSAVNEDDRTSTVHHVESTDRADHGQRIVHVSFKCSSTVFCLRPLMAPAGLRSLTDIDVSAVKLWFFYACYVRCRWWYEAPMGPLFVRAAECTTYTGWPPKKQATVKNHH